MKLYENKVGRPSNETLKKRRNFSLAITLGVLLLIGATTLTVTKLSTNGLKGSVNGKNVVYTSQQTVYEYKAHPASYKMTNRTGKTLYYRWFTYADSNYNGKATYVQPICSSLAKGKTYTTKPTITLSAKNPTRAGKLRLYTTSSACNSDKKGTSTSSKIYGTYVTTIKYQSLASALSITATDSQSYKSYGTYPVAITLNNETGKTYYYRWFTYNTSNASGNPSYYDKTCGSYSSKRTSNPTLKIDESNPYRSGKMKVYKTAASCSSDTSGTASNSNVINSKVVNVSYAGAVKEPNKVSKYSSTIYVGDSRTVGMCISKGNSTANCACDGYNGGCGNGTCTTRFAGKDVYIAQLCKGYTWFKNTAMSLLKNELNKNQERNVVINMGTNDLSSSSMANNYVEQYKALKKAYPKINLVIVSITPVGDSMAARYGYTERNANVIAFNNKLKPAVTSASGIKYCDVYSKVINNYTTVDGLHYNSSTYINIYNAIQACL